MNRKEKQGKPHKKELSVIGYIWDNRMTIRDFCKLIGYSDTHFHQVIAGKNAPTVKLANQIEKITEGKVKAETFMVECMQAMKNPLHSQGEN